MSKPRIIIWVMSLCIFGLLCLVMPNRCLAQAAPQAPAPAEDILSADRDVEIKSGAHVGDAVLAGMNVNINGKVDGYAMTAGMNVNINEPIGNDLWAAGSNVTVNAPITDNAMIAGGNVSLSKNASVGHDANIAGNSVAMNGSIARNLKLAAENVQISGEVGGNVMANVGKMTVAPGAIIQGDLIVNSPNEPIISPEARVMGKVDHRFAQRDRESGSFGGWLISWILSFLWLAVLGIVFVLISSVTANRITNTIKTNPGGAALSGFLAVIAIPVAIILLLITVIGLKVALVLAAVYFVAILMSGVFASYFVGEWILGVLKQFHESHIARIVVGASIVSFAYSLPWIGFLATLAVLFFGVGALVLERRDFFRQVRSHGLA